MNPILRNILAVVCGWLGGSIVNMGLVQIGHNVYPIEGVDLNDFDAVSAIMPNLSVEYFIFPFLAHALGTLVGGVIAYFIAANHKMRIVFIIGGLFLVGGILINFMLGGPIWFIITDLLLAYIPMAWLALKIGKSFSRS